MTGKERLKVLGNYLVSGSVDDEKFAMTAWPTCAIGEGTRIPSLSREGLTLERHKGLGGLEPSYEGETGFTACARFFKISDSVAHRFFNGNERTALKVGRQILSYLRKH